MKKIILFCLVFFFISCANEYDFSLDSKDGIVNLKDFKGQKVIVYFGFSFCPDVCPTTLSLLSNALKKLDLKEEPKLLFITLDIERDTNLKELNEWLKYFYENSEFLRAKNINELKKLTKKYNVIYEKIDLKDSALQYSLAHSNDIFLFDDNGNLVKTIKNLSEENLRRELADFLLTE